MVNNLFDQQPIIACSSGMDSNSAIAVIRISGFVCISDFQDFCSINLLSLIPNKASLANIVFKNTIFDQAVLIFFKSPNSYSGENILEISVHGNVLNVRRILDIFVSSKKCRYARPGEFSYRAFLNKKLTLSQVEGLDLFLNATSSVMLSSGMSILNGNLNNHYIKLHKLFIKVKASVELAIDFADDIGEETLSQQFDESLSDLISHLKFLNEKTKVDSSSLASPNIVIFGPPNAGKSTLFNFLLNENRAIVTSIPGTTRDYITEYFSISGATFKLVDTAGIRNSSDSIEKIGIDNSLKLLSNSFFKILVINPFDFANNNNFKKFQSISYDLLIVTHSDIDGFNDKLKLVSNYFSKNIEEIHVSLAGPIGPNDFDGSIGPLIFDLISKKYRNLINKEPILIDRQCQLISSTFKNLLNFQEVTKLENDIAIISSELSLIENDLSELIGIISPNQILSSIFANFCIGK